MDQSTDRFVQGGPYKGRMSSRPCKVPATIRETTTMPVRGRVTGGSGVRTITFTFFMRKRRPSLSRVNVDPRLGVQECQRNRA